MKGKPTMPKAKKKADETKKVSPSQCLVIQWAKTHVDRDGNPVCPDCGAPAEMVLGAVGNPCWAHKIVRSKR